MGEDATDRWVVVYIQQGVPPNFWWGVDKWTRKLSEAACIHPDEAAWQAKMTRGAVALPYDEAVLLYG